jgi:hypothetical protein
MNREPASEAGFAALGRPAHNRGAFPPMPASVYPFRVAETSLPSSASHTPWLEASWTRSRQGSSGINTARWGGVSSQATMGALLDRGYEIVVRCGPILTIEKAGRVGA